MGELQEVQRSEICKILDGVVLNDVFTTRVSHPIDCAAFRRFILYLEVLSAGSPTTVQFIVQFARKAGDKPHTYKQGLFASLFYEDADTTTKVSECFSGEVCGHVFSLKAVGVGTTAAKTFTVSAWVEFWD